MEKSGRILLTDGEYKSFMDTGEVPRRISLDWNIQDPLELKQHLQSGFAEVIDNNSNTTGDSL